MEGNSVTQYDLEQILYYERLMRFCYRSLRMMVHNRTIRYQCETFFQWSESHEAELRKVFLESSNITSQAEYSDYSLPPEQMNIESLLDLGLNVAEARLKAYQHIKSYSLDFKIRIIINSLIAHVEEELKFFNREKEVVGVEEVLYSLN